MKIYLNLFLVFILCILLFTVNIAKAAERIVTDYTDTFDIGTLRNTVGAAGDGDTITFSTEGDITLGSQLYIEVPTLTIGSADTAFTLKGNGADRVIEAYVFATPTTVTLNNISINDGVANGDGGGVYISSGIFKAEESVTFSNNTATSKGGALSVSSGDAQFGNGAVVVGNTALNQMGGGIYIGNGNLSFGDNATLQNNTTTGSFGDGGGAFVSGDISFGNNAQIIGNISSVGGGGLYASGGDISIGDAAQISGNKAQGANGDGGGMLVLSGDATFGDNVTFVGNEATGFGGGVYVRQGNIEFGDDATIASNISHTNTGGGVAALTGTIVIGKNATITGNEATLEGGAIYSGDGAIRIGDGATITDNKSITLDGGAIYSNVGVVEIGNDSYIGKNQAQESGGGIFSQTDAVILGNNVIIRENVALAADGGGVNTEEEGITAGDGLLVYKNTAQNYGGGLYVAQGDVDIGSNAQIVENKALTADGGGVAAMGGNIHFDDGALITLNQAQDSGGGIFIQGGVLSFGDNATISSNTAHAFLGGGVANLTGDVTFGKNTVIRDNEAAGHGGGIYAASGNVIFDEQTTIFNNTSHDDGGGINALAGSVEAQENTIIASNTADGSGGGIYITTGNLTLGNNTILEDNIAINSNGGGVHVASGAITFGSNSIIAGNTAGGRGGGIYAVSGTLTLGDNALLTQNKAIEGGAVYSSGNASFGKKATFTNNTAQGSASERSGLGGAIYSAGDLTINGATFSNNRAVSGSAGSVSSGRGGAIFHDAKSGNHTLTFNSAPDSPIVFAYNTQNIAQSGATRNSLYFGNTQLGGATNTTTVNFSVANGAQILMLDPMASQVDGLTDGHGQYGDVKVDINKTGLGTWVLGGYNDMQSATNWSISDGTLHLVSNQSNNPSSIAHINMSNAQSSFTLGAPATLLVTPSTVPHKITANDITFANGSQVGIAGFQYGPVLDSREHVVLELEANNTLVNDSTPIDVNGVIYVGPYQYDYTDLRWVDSEQKLVINLTRRAIDPVLANSFGVTAPGAVTLHNPAAQVVMDRAQKNFYDLRTDKKKRSRNLWALPAYSYSERNASGNGRYHLNIPSVTAGYDFFINDDYFLGVAGSYLRPEFKHDESKLEGDGYTLQLYGGARLLHEFEIAGHVAYDYVDYDQNRSVFGEGYSSSFHTNAFRAGAELGRTFEITKTVSLRPLVGYDYIDLDINGYTESSGTYALALDSSQQKMHRLRTGGGVSWNPWGADNASITGKAWYQGLYGDVKGRSQAVFVGDPGKNEFASTGLAEDRNSFGAEVSLNVSLSDTITLEGGYSLLKGAHTESHMGSFAVSFGF